MKSRIGVGSAGGLFRWIDLKVSWIVVVEVVVRVCIVDVVVVVAVVVIIVVMMMMMDFSRREERGVELLEGFKERSKGVGEEEGAVSGRGEGCWIHSLFCWNCKV